MPYCPECGHEVGATDRFCQECGSRLDQTGGPLGGGSGGQGRGYDQSQSREHRGQGGRPGRGGQGGRPGRGGQGGRTGRGGQGGRTGRGGQGRRTGRGGSGSRTGRDEWGSRTGRDAPPDQQYDNYGGERWSGADRQRTHRPDGEGLLGFSLSYPSRGGLMTVLVGALVLLFFWLIIPIFLAIGYFLRLAASAAAGRPEPPEFDDWGGMLKDGFVFVVASLPIWLPYWILSIVTQEVSAGLYLVLILLGAYLFPAIFVNFAVERHWRAIYDVSLLTDLMTTSEYVVGFLIYTFLINGVGFFVVLILLLVTLFTIVGWIILWPLIFFYWYAIDAALWGQVYYQVMGPATIPDPPAHELPTRRRDRRQAQSRQPRRY